MEVEVAIAVAFSSVWAPEAMYHPKI